MLVEGDQFFAFLAEGAIEPWLPESNHQNEIVTEAAALATGRFAADYEVVYDGILGPWFLPSFASATGLDELDYVIVLPSVEVCVARTRNRSRHSFRDDNAARKMHLEFEAAHIDERHVLRDESAGPAGTVEAIRLARSIGQLRYVIDS